MSKHGEIAYFGALSDVDQAHAIGKPFSDIHAGVLLARIGQIVTLLPPAPARILDLGCGTGWTSRFLAQCGYEVVGVDIAPDMVAAAREAADGLETLSFVVADYESLDKTDGFGGFDGVVFFDSLHHAEDEYVALKAAFSALGEGGCCVVAEPGKGHHKAAASLHAVETYGVNEKEMPPTKVLGMARQVGFSKRRVVANHGQLLTLLNGPHRINRPGLVGVLLNLPIVRPLAALGIILGLKYLSGVVVLTR